MNKPQGALLYSQLRNRLTSGDVIAYKHKVNAFRSFYDFRIFLIRLFTTSDYTHVGLIWRTAGRVFILEAVASGVRIYPLSGLESFTWLDRKGWTERNLEKALSKIGEPYSYIEAAVSPFTKLKMLSGSWQCAKFVCYVLGLPVPRMTPEGVVDYLCETEGLLPRVVKVDQVSVKE